MADASANCTWTTNFFETRGFFLDLVLNKMAFNLFTKMQNLKGERSGKEAPSKPMLKAGFSNPEALLTTMAQLFSAEK